MYVCVYVSSQCGPNRICENVQNLHCNHPMHLHRSHQSADEPISNQEQELRTLQSSADGQF